MSRVFITIIQDSGKAYLVKNSEGHIAWTPQNWVRKDLSMKESTFNKNNEEYELRERIRLKDTGKPTPNCDPDDLVEITNSDLDDIIVGTNGIKHSQLAILGAYPLESGWKKKLIGTLICKRKLELAKSSKGLYLNNERIISCIYDEPRLILVYEEEITNQRSALKKNRFLQADL